MAEEIPQPVWKSAVRQGGRAALTLLVIGVAAGAVFSGRGFLATQAASVPVPEPAPRTTVATDRIAMVDHFTTERRFSGQFEARQETQLGFEQGGRIDRIFVVEGDHVEEGAVLARLDTRALEAERTRLKAELRAVEAEAELARRMNDRQTELRARGHASDMAVDDTALRLARLEAQSASVAAALEGVEIALSKATLHAPFAGRIGTRFLDQGAVVGGGQPLVTLLEEGPARFRVGLAPDLADGLNLGDTAVIGAGETRLDATLVELSPELDPATRSRTALFEVVGEARPAARSTGELILTGKVVATGAWVPLSALRQGVRGTWTLLTLAEDGDAFVVVPEAAEILHAEAGRVFVRGTFRDGASFLPTGTHRVVPGETVLRGEVSE